MKAIAAAEIITDILESQCSSTPHDADTATMWSLSLMSQVVAALLSGDKEMAIQAARELVSAASIWGGSGKENDVLLLVQTVEEDEANIGV